MGDDRTPGEKATEAAIEVGVTAGAALLIGTVAPAPVALIGGRWVAKYVAEHLRRFRERREARVNAYVTDLAGRLGGEAAATERLESPDADDVVMESIRSLLNAIDDAVVPMLAALSKEYIDQGRSADRFLRGASKMFADCEKDDLDALRRVFKEVDDLAMEDDKRVELIPRPFSSIEGFAVPAAYDMDELDDRRDHADSIDAIFLRVPAPATAPVPPTRDISPTRMTEPLRVIHLLVNNGLARVVSLWGTDGASMVMGDARRLARALAAG